MEGATESIRLFSICSAMNWCHLPTPGGIYAQHPKLLDDWMVIWEAQGVKQRRDSAKAEAASAAKKGKR